MSRRRKPRGIYFQPGTDYWEIAVHGEPLVALLPIAEILEGSNTLYVENPRSPAMRRYLEDRHVSDPTEVAAGNVWPRPVAFHVPMTAEVVAGLVALGRELAPPEVSDHVLAYRGDIATLLWYDFPVDPVYLLAEVPEAEIEALCHELGATYRRASG